MNVCKQVTSLKTTKEFQSWIKVNRQKKQKFNKWPNGRKVSDDCRPGEPVQEGPKTKALGDARVGTSILLGSHCLHGP